MEQVRLGPIAYRIVEAAYEVIPRFQNQTPFIATMG